MIKGTLYGVGVGPGDPRLMTYLAVDTIQKCPVIAVPADGKENAVSYKIASGIVENLDEKECLNLTTPMTKDKAVLNAAYQAASDQIIEQLIDSVENGQNVPFAPGKVSVNKEETIRLLRELENIVQGELKIYREVNDRKGKILTEAKKEAEEILTQAEQNASRIRVTKRMSTLPAFHPGDLEPEDREALRTAGDIYAASLIYTDEMLTEVNDLLADSYDLVKQQYAKMVETLEEKTRIVAENKAELMGNLKELSKEERYAQILELGQLLSNELYDEKNKVKLAAAKKKPVKLEYEEETGKEEKEQKS